MNTAIRTRDLTKTYDITVLDHVDLDVFEGQFVAIMGPSGSGKSTLLHCISGMDRPTSGTVVLADTEITALDERQLAALRLAKLGFVFQQAHLMTTLNLLDNIVLPGFLAGLRPRPEITAHGTELMRRMGIEHLAGSDVTELSGGQKQRLALAGVLAMRAGLILLDEPTANLDPRGVVEVVDAVRHAVENTGATLVVVEHRVAQWMDLITRVIVIGNGRVIADGPPELVAELELPGVWLPNAPMPAWQRRTSDTPLLRAEELVVGYSKPVGSPRNLSLPKGAATVITGPNGAGKTTLALTLAGLLKPLGGRITGFGSEPHTWKSRALARRIGYVFQDPEHQFVARTVLEEMRVGPQVMGVAAEARIAELLHRLRLEHLARANPFTLSGGQQRRLSVATALVAAPELLILDEPTFGQDRRTFIELVQILRDLTAEGVTICAISHDELFLEALGDYEVALQ